MVIAYFVIPAILIKLTGNRSKPFMFWKIISESSFRKVIWYSFKIIWSQQNKVGRT